MRKAMATVMVAWTLLAGLATASPALAVQGDTQLCSPSTNGGTLVNGVCVLPALNVGQNAEEFLLNSSGSVDIWTIVSGSIPPGMQMPSVFGAAGTVVAGTPTQQGTFTFTVDNVPFNNPSAPPSQGTYSITVNPPLPLKVVLPASGSTLSPGTVGVSYAQNFFLSGGVAPYTWSVASGELPPGLALRSPFAPNDNNSQLAGTPTQNGTFKFTMKVTDSSGQSASQEFSLTIKQNQNGRGS
jgi:large repetitive protein